MISHEYKCIFIHIPKCAGTSIETALGHLVNHNGRFGQDHRSIRMIERPFLYTKTFLSTENIIELLRREKYQHFDKIYNFRNKYTVTKQQYNSYFKFTIVRNPWSRAFSWYINVMRDDIHLKNYGVTTDLSFKEFLLQFAGKKMLRSQIYWLKSFNGSIPLDYIGRFENLQEDIHEIFKRLKMENVSLPHILNSPKDDYRKYYDNETNDIILNFYKEDIDAFGYTFDNKY
jgi:hypothetical protein